MNGLDLLKGIGEIDDDLIAEAYIEGTHRKSSQHAIWKHWGSAAACLLCVGAVSMIAYHVHSGSIVENNTDTTAMDIAVQALPPTDMSDSAEETVEAVPYVAAEADASEECNLQAAPAHDWSDYMIINEYPGKMDAVYCYAQPAQGSYFLYHYLSETLAQNETAAGMHPYAYDVNISVFVYDEPASANGRQLSGETQADQQLLTQEYERLLELGYDVRLSDSCQLSGIFTKEDLNNFPVNDKYGYAIYFADEP